MLLPRVACAAALPLHCAPMAALVGASASMHAPLVEQRRFGFPRGTKRTPRYYWDERAIKERTGGEYTHKPLENVPRLGGRDPDTGRKVSRHVGGGAKFDYIMADPHRMPKDAPENHEFEERILEVRRDPTRSAWIALVAGARGKRWLTATHGMTAGDVIKTTNVIPVRPLGQTRAGDAYPLGALAPGTTICLVEPRPGVGVQFVYNAGAKATVQRHTATRTVVAMPHRRGPREYAYLKECMCVVGQVSNPDWKDLVFGTGNMHRRFGWRQQTVYKEKKKDSYQGRRIYKTPPLQLDHCRMGVSTNITITQPNSNALTVETMHAAE